jgi:hypothetical protein
METAMQYGDNACLQHENHKKLLAGEKIGLNVDEPLAGYYRTRRSKDGPLLPVHIWTEGDFDTVRAVINGVDIPFDKIWPWCGKAPISREHYDTFMATGKWADVEAAAAAKADRAARTEAEKVATTDFTAASQADNKRARMGGNNPPEDIVVILREQIDSATAGAATYAIIGGDKTSDADGDALAAKAQTLRSRCLELSNEADNKRVAEKEPYLLKCRAIDDAWQPLVKSAKATADSIRASLSAWETIKLGRRRKLEQETQARLDAERKAAIEKAEAESAKTGAPMSVAWVPPVAPPAAPPRKIKGGAGRGASIGIVKVVKEVNDWTALFQHFRLYPEVQALLIKFANEQLRAGNTVPGVVTEEKADVK